MYDIIEDDYRIMDIQMDSNDRFVGKFFRADGDGFTFVGYVTSACGNGWVDANGVICV